MNAVIINDMFKAMTHWRVYVEKIETDTDGFFSWNYSSPSHNVRRMMAQIRWN